MERDDRLAASSMIWIFSSSTGRLGSKKRMLRLVPMTCLNSMGAPLARQHGDDDGGRIAAEEAAAVLGQRHLGTLDLAGAAAAPELVGQLHELGAAGGPDGVALGQQPTAGVDGDPSAEGGFARGQQLRPPAGPAH